MIDEVRLIGDIHAYFHKKIDADEKEIIDNDILTLNKEICGIIKEQPKVGEWIPVSERLPDDKDYVLVCATEPEEGVFISHYIEESNKWLYESDEGVYYELHVIAWMPLPDPYQT